MVTLSLLDCGGVVLLLLLKPESFNCLLYVLRTVCICCVEIVTLHTFLGIKHSFFETYMYIYYRHSLSKL